MPIGFLLSSGKPIIFPISIFHSLATCSWSELNESLGDGFQIICRGMGFHDLVRPGLSFGICGRSRFCHEFFRLHGWWDSGPRGFSLMEVYGFLTPRVRWGVWKMGTTIFIHPFIYFRTCPARKEDQSGQENHNGKNIRDSHGIHNPASGKGGTRKLYTMVPATTTVAS